jgi:hypothetical protein
MWDLERENLDDFYGWNTIFSDFYIDDNLTWDTESLNSEFYTAEMAAWTDVFRDYTFADQKEWTIKLKPTSTPKKDLFLGVAEAPEDMHVFIEEFYINPEDIQADYKDWTIFGEPD